jgi:hypothetical protein
MSEVKDESGPLGCVIIVIIVLAIVATIYFALRHWRW